MINNGEPINGHGSALLNLKDKTQLKPVVNKTIKENLSVRQVELLVQQMNVDKPKEQKPKVKKDIFITENENRLRDHFGTSVKIHKGKNKGKIEIEFFNDDDLNRIIEMLSQ